MEIDEDDVLVSSDTVNEKIENVGSKIDENTALITLVDEVKREIRCNFPEEVAKEKEVERKQFVHNLPEAFVLIEKIKAFDDEEKNDEVEIDLKAVLIKLEPIETSEDAYFRFSTEENKWQRANETPELREKIKSEKDDFLVSNISSKVVKNSLITLIHDDVMKTIHNLPEAYVVIEKIKIKPFDDEDDQEENDFEAVCNFPENAVKKREVECEQLVYNLPEAYVLIEKMKIEPFNDEKVDNQVEIGFNSVVIKTEPSETSEDADFRILTEEKKWQRANITPERRKTRYAAESIRKRTSELHLLRSSRGAPVKNYKMESETDDEEEEDKSDQEFCLSSEILDEDSANFCKETGRTRQVKATKDASVQCDFLLPTTMEETVHESPENVAKKREVEDKPEAGDLIEKIKIEPLDFVQMSASVQCDFQLRTEKDKVMQDEMKVEDARKRKMKANETPEQRRRHFYFAKKFNQKRANETPEEHQKRLYMQQKYKQRMAEETPEQHERRISIHWERQRQKRANQTPEQHKKRYAAENARKRQKKANETPEQRKQIFKVLFRKKRDDETSEEYQKRFLEHRKYRRKMAKETPEKRELRLSAIRESKRQKIANETPDERERRLSAIRERKRQKIADETPEQHEKRLSIQAERMRLKIANETPDERERRLSDKAERKRQKIANETPDERELRLSALRERKRQKIANETLDERERRLSDKAERERQKIANETPEQREKRLSIRAERVRKQIANETPEQRENIFLKWLKEAPTVIDTVNKTIENVNGKVETAAQLMLNDVSMEVTIHESPENVAKKREVPEAGVLFMKIKIEPLDFEEVKDDDVEIDFEGVKSEPSEALEDANFRLLSETAKDTPQRTNEKTELCQNCASKRYIADANYEPNLPIQSVIVKTEQRKSGTSEQHEEQLSIEAVRMRIEKRTLCSSSGIPVKSYKMENETPDEESEPTFCLSTEVQSETCSIVDLQLSASAERKSWLKSNETPEQSKQHFEAHTGKLKEKRANETPEEHQKRLYLHRRYRQKPANETPDESTLKHPMRVSMISQEFEDRLVSTALAKRRIRRKLSRLTKSKA